MPKKRVKYSSYLFNIKQLAWPEPGDNRSQSRFFWAIIQNGRDYFGEIFIKVEIDLRALTMMRLSNW
jgi:hypothetical protein